MGTMRLGAGLGEGASCPRSCRHDERCIWELFATEFAQLRLPLRIEARSVGAGRADTKREGLPPVFEARMLDAHRKSGALDLAQPRCLEQLGQMALASAGEGRFVFDLGVELSGCLPEGTERSLTASVIPHACGDDAILVSHA